MRRTVLLSLVAAFVGILVLPLAAQQVLAKDLRFAVTDLEGLEQLQREFGPFRDTLSKLTGLSIKLYPVPNRTAAVEAMRAGQVELVLTGPAEYVIFQNRTNARPIAGFSRPDYFADLIVLADSGITEVKELKGKKVALGAVGSTSKHLAPMQIMKDNGLDPLRDVKVVHISSYKTAWEALKRGDVQAFGITDDKFLALRSKESDLPAGAFRVIARGRDLPNDILLAHPQLDPAVVSKLQSVLQDHSKELVAAILKGEDNQKFRGMKFLVGVKDSDYAYIRDMYRTAGHTKFAQFLGD
jgi:phosphonate transport system substrate-binding protein